jgi:hypothetical protein
VGDSLSLRGRVLEAVVPLLAQGHSLDRIIELGSLEPAEVMSGLIRLTAVAEIQLRPKLPL